MLRWTTRFLAGIAVVAQAAMSQSTFATITGVVSDPAGAAVPGAKIEVTNRGHVDSARVAGAVAGRVVVRARRSMSF